MTTMDVDVLYTTHSENEVAVYGSSFIKFRVIHNF